MIITATEILERHKEESLLERVAATGCLDVFFNRISSIMEEKASVDVEHKRIKQ